ncbi:MAG TPA: hypothetical protein EYH06_08530, partial [Chromatiales bacterium]|nr:hypothetical protein [Chromatiales bacterium]
HDRGEFEIEVPRDRNGSFEPQLVKKGQTRLTEVVFKVLCHFINIAKQRLRKEKRGQYP